MADLAIYEKKVFPAAEEATGLEVKDEKSEKRATELLSELNVTLDKIEEEEGTIVNPAKEVIKREQARWSPFKVVLKPAIQDLRTKLGEYRTAEAEKAAEKEAAIAARVGAGKGKLKDETAMKQISEIKRSDKMVATEKGAVRYRTDKVLKITDEALLPREYLVPDEKRILADLKNGTKIPGAVIKEVQTPINIR